MLEPGSAARDDYLGHDAPQLRWLRPSNAHGVRSVAKNLLPLLALYTALPWRGGASGSRCASVRGDDREKDAGLLQQCVSGV
jgi:hypothetical protein